MARKAVKVDPPWQCKHCGTMDLKKKRAGFMNTKVCKDCMHWITKSVRPARIEPCTKCGKEYEARATNAKYCPECRRIVALECARKEQERWRKIRSGK